MQTLCKVFVNTLDLPYQACIFRVLLVLKVHIMQSTIMNFAVIQLTSRHYSLVERRQSFSFLNKIQILIDSMFKLSSTKIFRLSLFTEKNLKFAWLEIKTISLRYHEGMVSSISVSWKLLYFLQINFYLVQLVYFCESITFYLRIRRFIFFHKDVLRSLIAIRLHLFLLRCNSFKKNQI